MNVTHLVGERRISVRSENPHFLLVDDGTYLALGNPNHSNYDGLFVEQGGQRYKVMANVTAAGVTGSLEIGDDSVKRTFLNGQGSWQRFSVGKSGMLMEGDGEFLLTLDCKRLYDESDQGRHYSIRNHGPRNAHASARSLERLNIIDITYTKRADGSPDAPIAYQLHVCIATTMEVIVRGRWREVSYAYDARRGTQCTPWVYDTLALSGHGTLAVAAGADAHGAQQEALDLLLRQRSRPAHPLPMHAQLAARALLALRTEQGIMAGLPWFFHHWSRDELIACGGLLAAGAHDDAARIIDKWYRAVRADGTLPAIYPDQGLESSDAPGWLGRRTLDLLDLRDDVPQEALARWRDQSGLLLDRLAQRLRDDLVWTGPNTTWMDTSKDDDGRAGARIEIQALAIALCEAHTRLCALTGTPALERRAQLALRITTAVHRKLVSDGILIDGLHGDGTPDTAARPNVFLAWYVAPRLLSQQQWERTFRHALDHLWLDWGGLASIAKGHPGFRSHYTGEDVASYHRGDSWYFVNNIAAMALHAVSPQAFGERVAAILRASMRDLLELGFAGHCSEVSSAAAQEACGCHAQAWSASTLLEALLRIGAEQALLVHEHG